MSPSSAAGQLASSSEGLGATVRGIGPAQQRAVSSLPRPTGLPAAPLPPTPAAGALTSPSVGPVPASDDADAIGPASLAASRGLRAAAAQAQAAVDHLPSAQALSPAASPPAAAPGPPTAVPAPSIAPPEPVAMESEAAQLMDQAYGPTLRQQTAAQSAAGAALLASHDSQVGAEQSQAHLATRQAQQETVTAQLAERTATATAVAGRRELWPGEQSAVAGEYTQQVSSEQAAAQSDVSSTMSSARAAAQAQLADAGRQAEAAQDGSGARPTVQGSWWSRVKGAVSAGVSAVSGGIRAVGSAASDLYTAARSRAGALLDAARDAVRSRLGAFWGALSGALNRAVSRLSAAARAAAGWIGDRLRAGVARMTALARSLANRLGALGRRFVAALAALGARLRDGLLTVYRTIASAARRMWEAGRVLWQIAKVIKDGAVRALVMLIEAPGQALEYIKDFVAGLVARAPGKLEEVMATHLAPRLGAPSTATTSTGPAVQRQEAPAAESAQPESRWEAVKRHLSVRLGYVQENWWQVIKDAALEILVPGLALYRHFPTMITELGASFREMLAGNYSVAFDHLLAVARSAMAIVSSFVAQVSIAAFIIGSIIGTPIVGVAALEAIGITVLLVDGSVQLLSLAQALDNLDRARTPEQHEADYGLIADSGIALTLMAILVALGAMASAAIRRLLARFPALAAAAESVRARMRAKAGLGPKVPESPRPHDLRQVEAGIERVQVAGDHPIRARLTPEQQLAFDRFVAERIEEGFQAGKSAAEINAGLDAALAGKDPEAVARMLRRQITWVREQQGRRDQAAALRQGDPLNPPKAIGPIDEGGNVATRYDTLAGKPSAKEIGEAQRLASRTGEHIELFGDHYSGIDGTIGNPPRPLQLKGYTGGADEAVTMAQTALTNAKGAPYSRVEVSIEAPSVTVAEATRAFRAVPPGTVTDGVSVARVRVWCKDGMFEPTSFRPVVIPPHVDNDPEGGTPVPLPAGAGPAP
ncbi:hypothetical protein GCM10009616_29290 [Microlunatus lacustris]